MAAPPPIPEIRMARGFSKSVSQEGREMQVTSNAAAMRAFAPIDHLKLKADPKCFQMLMTKGEGYPSIEKVLYSTEITKINRKEVSQQRWLLITNKAWYNLGMGDASNMKRRIPLSTVAAMTISEKSTEFLIHVPNEYDYRYASDRREEITTQVSKIFDKFLNKKLKVAGVKTEKMTDLVLTKTRSEFLSREERRRRYHELVNQPDAGDAKDKSAKATRNICGEANPSDFDYLSVIGRGAFGKVLLVRKKDNDMVYAMKILTKSQMMEEGAGESGVEIDGIAPRLIQVHKTRSLLLQLWKKHVFEKNRYTVQRFNYSVPKDNLTRAAVTAILDRAPKDHELEGLIKRIKEFTKKVVDTLPGSLSAEVIAAFKSTLDTIKMRPIKSPAEIEEELLSSMRHPFLMALRYAFETQESLYFVLDFYQGGELFFHLREHKRFDLHTCRLWVAEITLALEHLHNMSIIYRDMKPENILLDSMGHICLTDFGLAKNIFTEPEKKSHTFCGTPEYLAPEVVEGKGHSYGVDWWAVGVLLYELVVGIAPFYAPDQNQIYKRIQTCETVLASVMPKSQDPYFKDIVTKLLKKDPLERLGSIGGSFSIKGHAFFKNIDFPQLLRKEIKMPFKPDIKGDGDLRYFDREFTDEKMDDELVAAALAKKTGSVARGTGGYEDLIDDVFSTSKKPSKNLDDILGSKSTTNKTKKKSAVL